jgi:hypothetical protein
MSSVSPGKAAINAADITNQNQLKGTSNKVLSLNNSANGYQE